MGNAIGVTTLGTFEAIRDSTHDRRYIHIWTEKTYSGILGCQRYDYVCKITGNMVDIPNNDPINIIGKYSWLATDKPGQYRIPTSLCDKLPEDMPEFGASSAGLIALFNSYRQQGYTITATSPVPHNLRRCGEIRNGPSEDNFQFWTGVNTNTFLPILNRFIIEQYEQPQQPPAPVPAQNDDELQEAIDASLRDEDLPHVNNGEIQMEQSEEQTSEQVNEGKLTCKICLNNFDSLYAFIPCGHKLLCITCSDIIIKQNPACCIICRKPVTGTVHIFDS